MQDRVLWASMSAAQLLAEIETHHRMLEQMVGTLYREIIFEKLLVLRDYYEKAKEAER
jgi:hypothetical protein